MSWDNHVYLDGEDIYRIRTGKKVSTSVANNGYLVFGIGRKVYLYHRVKYFLLHGVEPECVDHIDRDKLNNHSSNLRAATYKENARNQCPTSSIQSGMKNVYYRKDTGKYQVRIKVNQEIKNFGTFSCVEEAKKVATMKRQEIFGEFNGETTKDI